MNESIKHQLYLLWGLVLTENGDGSLTISNKVGGWPFTLPPGKLGDTMDRLSQRDAAAFLAGLWWSQACSVEASEPLADADIAAL